MIQLCRNKKWTNVSVKEFAKCLNIMFDNAASSRLWELTSPFPPGTKSGSSKAPGRIFTKGPNDAFSGPVPAPSHLQHRLQMWPKGTLRAHSSRRQWAVFPLQNPFKKDQFTACYINHREETRKLAKGTPAWAHLLRQLGVSVCLDIRMREEKESPSLLFQPGRKEKPVKSRGFGIYETLKKWIEFTTLLIQYISWRWAVNPVFSLTWWSAAASSGVDEWCNSLLFFLFFLVDIYSVVATVAAECKLLPFWHQAAFCCFQAAGW